MKYIDLNILADNSSLLQDLVSMSEVIGYSGLAIDGFDLANHSSSSPIELFSRINMTSKRLPTLKKELPKIQNKHMIIAIPLAGVEAANWAAEEPHIDFLTLIPSEKDGLRKTTARLAARNDTALEVSINPLLLTQGLNRSRILKTMTDAIKVASHCEMKVVLTSGAHDPLHMRSPYAMVNIGMFLGLTREKAIQSISEYPQAIIKRNMKRLDDGFIQPGLEIVGEK